MFNKGLVSNSFTYEGEVSFKLKRNNKLYTINTHNAGTKFLVDAIAKALAGNDITSNLPKYLDFIYTFTNDGEEQIGKLITSPTPFTGIVWGDAASVETLDNNTSCLLLSATIAATEKLTVAIEEVDSIQLCMKSLNGDILAYIKDDVLKDLYQSLTDGTDAVIEWRMLFKNKIEESK